MIYDCKIHMKTHIVLLLTTLLVLSACTGVVVEDQIREEGEDNMKTSKTAGTKVKLETNHGDIVIRLFDAKAPITTDNFKKLVSEGFYDGTIFHRVIPEFMIQGGDPEGTGMGGPGYTIDDEFHPELKHTKAGILSMANAGPNTGGSQFFITVAPTPWLDGKHAVFGEVVEGLEDVIAISEMERDPRDKPLEDVTIVKASIVE